MKTVADVTSKHEQLAEDSGIQMAARNNRPRMGFSKPEQGAAAQEERDMWERVKADMMRANGLKKQSDELEKQLIQMKARISGDWKSTFNLTFGLVLHFVRSLRYIAPLIVSLNVSIFSGYSVTLSFRQLIHLSHPLDFSRPRFGLQVELRA